MRKEGPEQFSARYLGVLSFGTVILTAGIAWGVFGTAVKANAEGVLHATKELSGIRGEMVLIKIGQAVAREQRRTLKASIDRLSNLIERRRSADVTRLPDASS